MNNHRFLETVNLKKRKSVRFAKRPTQSKTICNDAASLVTDVETQGHKAQELILVHHNQQ